MQMHNLKVVVRECDSAADTIRSIADKTNIHPDDPFAFSCIMTRDSKDNSIFNIKINMLEDNNPYSITELISKLYKQDVKDIMYVVPPLEQYVDVYRPLLCKMVNKAYKVYANLIPEKEELMGILMLQIVQLYNKGYYLHNNLIYKSFINACNMEIRKLKYHDNDISMDEVVSSKEGDVSLHDMIADPGSSYDAHSQYHYTEEDYWHDVFELIKDNMLKEMSKLSFDRILFQLQNKCVDNQTSKILMKYREKFNPGLVLRPNRKKQTKPVKVVKK